MSVPLILDCDPGHDDAFAILLAAGSPLADLRAITTVARQRHPRGGHAQRAEGLHPGRASATSRSPPARPARCAASCTPPPTCTARAASTAPTSPSPTSSWTRGRRSSSWPTCCATPTSPSPSSPPGPLTNVALLPRRGARRAREDRGRSSGWAASRGRGNRTPYAEFNAWVDPEAAEIVVDERRAVHARRPAPHAPRARDARGRGAHPRASAGSSPTSPPTGSATSARRTARSGASTRRCTIRARWRSRSTRPLATFEEAFVAIETQGRWTRGATVVDPFGRLGHPPNARVALELDVERFWSMLVAAIGAVGAPAR